MADPAERDLREEMMDCYQFGTVPAPKGPTAMTEERVARAIEAALNTDDLPEGGWPEICRQAARAAIASMSTPEGEVEQDSYAAWQQKRGMALDAIDEAINAYDDYMMDDDYDAQGCLDRIIKRLRIKRDVVNMSSLPSTVRGEVLEEAARECERQRDGAQLVDDAEEARVQHRGILSGMTVCAIAIRALKGKPTPVERPDV